MSPIPPLNAALAQPAVTASRRSLRRGATRFLSGLMIAAAGLLLIGWLVLHWFILPHIQQWRAPIEARVGAALGVTVRIGTIEVRTGGWVPGVELGEVVLLDAQQRVALRLPKVVAAFSPRSLLALDLRFEQLLIEGAELEVRRDTQGRIFVAGLDFGGTGAADDGRAADWFFKQDEFVIRNGAVRWIDEQRGAAPLALTDVQAVVRNSLRHHALRIDATPPPDWGERFTLQGRFTQRLLARSGDWKRWVGSVYASLPRADVRELKAHVTLPFQLDKGNGAARAWIDIKDGEARAATVDLALREVRLRLAPDVEALDFEQVEGRLEGRRDEDGIALALRRFSFRTGDGIDWPRGDLTLALQQREGAAPSGGTFSAQRLDVGVIAQVATRIPLGAPLRKLLADVAPRGIASDVAAKWEGPLDDPLRYQVKGQLRGLELEARASADPRELGRPGVRNATVDLKATESGGDARVGISAGAIDVPGVFVDPKVPLDQLSAQVSWKVEQPKGGARVSVQVKDAKFANRDARGEATASWTSGDPADSAHGGRFPGRLELDGKLGGVVAARIARYLPLGLPVAARSYVEGAIRGGTIPAASFRVRGPLRDFPFQNARSAKDGEFKIVAQVEDLTLAYMPEAPQWPPLSHVAGELVIDRSALEVRNGRGRVGALEWARIKGGIPNLAEHPVLGLEASAAGPLGEMLKFVNATPIGGWIGKGLATASASGTADLQFVLGLPLDAPGSASVKGSLRLPGNDMHVSADTPLLGNARGRVDFSQKGFTLVGATARVFGGDAAFDGGTQADDSIRIAGQGTATAEGLRHAPELGPVARIATTLTGQAAYRFTLGVVHGRPQLLVTSNLVGIGADLPYPLAKAAATALELRYQTAPAEEAPVGAQTFPESLRLDLGNVLQAHYVREQGDATARVLRGGIGVFGPAPTPVRGVAANLNLPRLNVDAWESAFEKLFGASPTLPATSPARAAAAAATPAPRAVAAPATAAASTAPAGGDDYVPDAIALRAQELEWGSRRITGVVVGASEEAGLWRANVKADQLDGYVEFRPARRRGANAPAGAASAGPGRIYARLARLSLPKSDVEQVESLLDEQSATAAVPGLDIVVDDFELRGKRLGRVEIEAANRIRREPGREAVREWRLAKFNVTVPEAQLIASGIWAAAPNAAGATAAPRRRASMDFRLVLNDSGALLERLGAGKAIRGGKGELAGTVAWTGSPLSPDYPSMVGEFNVAIDSGQFLKAEPGAARLLSVLSLQSLPRRLAFDFRDLFEQGFAFDNVTGDVSIGAGVARTNNLRMRGSAAVVLMEGSADIGRATQDLRVVVVPEINAGTASLAYAIINPAIGLGTFLAQVFLRKPLIEAGTREFHVSGPWDDPKVERVDRKRPQSVSAADPPASAASSPNQ